MALRSKRMIGKSKENALIKRSIRWHAIMQTSRSWKNRCKINNSTRLASVVIGVIGSAVQLPRFLSSPSWRGDDENLCDKVPDKDRPRLVRFKRESS